MIGFVIRVLSSFTSWIRAVLLTWGIVDGVASHYLYKEEKFFPYQFLRCGRIIANLAGIITPIIPIIWNISDGFYSIYLYKNAHPIEDIPRAARIINGSLLAVM